MKRKTLTTAVMAGLTGVAGMMSVANAVNVNPDGLGQVLLYPYYTARGGNDTLISVVNTTSAGKAVKIRFLEALNSREVLDFNIYLSPFDVWTAAVTDFARAGIDPEGGPGITIADSTCTAPYIFGDDGIQEFVDFQFASEPFEDPVGDDFAGTQDGGPTDIERAASGYIEIIEMGTMVAQPDPEGGAPATDEPGIVPWNAKHVDGAPRDCDFLVDLWRAPVPGVTPGPGELGYWQSSPENRDFGFEPAGSAMTGGLFGAASIINVTDGLMFSYNATAIDSFWQTGAAAFHQPPGDVLPSLNSSTQTTANSFVNGQVETTNWPAGLLSLNAAITVNQLMNEYAINQGMLSGRTEWVLTFPTKSFHVDNAPGGPNEGVPLEEAIPPFTSLWTVESPSSCDGQTFGFWDREEGPASGPVVPGDPGDVIISPPRPPEPGEPAPPGFQLCREANVVRFVNDDTLPAETEVLGEPLRTDGSGNVTALSYTNFQLPAEVISGWVQFDFDGFVSVSSSDPTPKQIRGLPVIGFSANTFSNSNIGDGVRASFGGTFQHRGTRTLAQPVMQP